MDPLKLWEKVSDMSQMADRVISLVLLRKSQGNGKNKDVVIKKLNIKCYAPGIYIS